MGRLIHGVRGLAGLLCLTIVQSVALAGSPAAAGSVTELRVIPTQYCIWSEHRPAPANTDKSIAGGVLEALAPGLIDTGIAWIGEMLKEAGERKVLPRYGTASIISGPDYELPSCLQLVYGEFNAAGGLPIGDQGAVSPERYDELTARYLATGDQRPPPLWLEVEIHYFPKDRVINGAYHSPTAYALVPTRLAWSRSIVNGKPATRRDLLVFVNLSAPMSAANESTTGFSSNPGSVARLSWYGLSAGRPTFDSVFSGRVVKRSGKDAEEVNPNGLGSYVLPPSSSAWAPFPATPQNQPLVVWANVTEAKDGSKALAKLGEALSARKAELTAELGTAVIPSQKEAASVEADTNEIAKIKLYVTAVTAVHLQADDFRQDCRRYSDAVLAGNTTASEELFRKVVEQAGSLLLKMNSAKEAGLGVSPRDQPFSDQVMNALQVNMSNPQSACKLL